MDKNYFEMVTEAKGYIQSKVKIAPKVMLILSGGLSSFVEKIENPVVIKAEDIPHFPQPTAEGHSGKMIFGKVGDLSLVALQGRFHYYEGHEMAKVIFPVFVINALGAKTLIVTNAVGGINKDFKSGDIMMITDHINQMGVNPLRGIANLRSENQFTDMTDAYSKKFHSLAKESAKAAGVELKEGVYIATPGPSYETKTETKLYRTWGADAVGMSVVPEITAANFLEMDTLGFSCIANAASDLHEGGMSHNEVLTNMKEMEGRLVKLLSEVTKRLS